LENTGIKNDQRIWERMFLAKDYSFEIQLSNDPMIFFVISGSMSIKINNTEEFAIYSNETFMTQFDNSYEITILEQTHLLICYASIESWFTEQKWIDSIVLDEIDTDNAKTNCKSDIFLKLSLKSIFIQYLSLMNLYLEDTIHSLSFYELKRQEMFFLLSHYYKKDELSKFLRCILSNDMQFKKFVVSNYLKAGDVKNLAELANYSTSGFIKKFKKSFKESPYKWMQKQKAKQISFEIKRGIKSLKEISNEYNFSSYQHFSVFCKSQLGAPPTKIIEK